MTREEIAEDQARATAILDSKGTRSCTAKGCLSLMKARMMYSPYFGGGWVWYWGCMTCSQTEAPKKWQELDEKDLSKAKNL